MVFQDQRTDEQKRLDAIRVRAGTEISRILLGEDAKDRAQDDKDLRERLKGLGYIS